jgi:uncharacterized glyoxalase superfamily protein PhnB
MTAAFKPTGYPTLSPYLMVQGAQRTIDFLTQAFGATELRRFDGPDGTIMHVELRIDDGIVMLSDGGEKFPPFPAWVHLYVADVDLVYRRALAAGGVSVQEPKQQSGDPDRRGGVTDPGGTTWWISTQVS